MNTTAIIVGDSGQDGTLFRLSLQKKGIDVVGIGRNRVSMPLAFGSSVNAGFSINNTEQVSN
jgi:hypothetical protein